MFRGTRRGRADRAGRSRESGQALLELALIAPILIMLLAGLVQFALIFESQIGITNAVREAARRGASLAAPDQPTAQANATWTLGQLQTLLANSQTHSGSRDTIEVCIVTPASKPLDASGTTQVVVRITESYRHPLFLPIVDLILDGIDGVSDRSLAASTFTEFHVEQTGVPNVGSGGFARSPAGGTFCTP